MARVGEKYVNAFEAPVDLYVMQFVMCMHSLYAEKYAFEMRILSSAAIAIGSAIFSILPTCNLIFMARVACHYKIAVVRMCVYLCVCLCVYPNQHENFYGISP